MSNIGFEHSYLLLLFPFFLLCMKYCLQKEDGLLFSNLTLLQRSSKKLSFLTLFQVLTLLFLTISLAKPYSLLEYEKKDKSTIAISLIVDVSLSMKEKFETLKRSLIDFIKYRKNDPISIVYFADYTALSSPLTKDTVFLTKSLQSIKTGDLGEMMSVLYDAIILSNDLLTSKELKNISIVLTDGYDKGSKSTMQDLFNSLSEKRSTIYTIGIGKEYDKELLKKISSYTNGSFFDANDIKKLNDILDSINKKYPKVEFKEKKLVKKPLYQIPLFFAFLSLLFYTYLLNKRAVV